MTNQWDKVLVNLTPAIENILLEQGAKKELVVDYAQILAANVIANIKSQLKNVKYIRR